MPNRAGQLTAQISGPEASGKIICLGQLLARVYDLQHISSSSSTSKELPMQTLHGDAAILTATVYFCQTCHGIVCEMCTSACIWAVTYPYLFIYKHKNNSHRRK